MQELSIRGLSVWVLASAVLAGGCDGPGTGGASPTGGAPDPAGPGPIVRRALSVSKAEPIPGEILVKFRDVSNAAALHQGFATGAGVSSLATAATPGAQAIAQTLGRHGVSAGEQILPNADSEELRKIVKVKDVADADAAIRDLQALPDVEYAEPNRRVHTVYVPSDPYYATSGSWGQGFRDLWGLQKMAMEPAWDVSKGAGIVVAVIDTGLDYDHPDIAANVWTNPGETGLDAQGRDKRSNGVDDDGDGLIDDWRGYDFSNGDNDPMDDHGHGTHVSGTIAAVANTVGIVGVAPSAKVMALKGLDSSGSGDDATLIKAIYFAANHGAKVINASWGGESDAPELAMADAINYVHDTKGVVFVAAAGNAAADVGTEDNGFFPANLRGTITVAASDHLDEAAFFTNLGVKIDVAAPGGGDGGNIWSDDFRTILSLCSSQAGAEMTGSGSLIVGGKYVRQAGTSMAAPHVAGLAALLMAKYPAYSPEQIRQMIRKGADDILDAGFDTLSGYGRANAQKSLAVTSPLAVHLISPAMSLTGFANADVTATVSGTGLRSWKLEYGTDLVPTSWTRLASGTAAVNANKLTTWNVSALSDGPYVLRLTATTSSGQTFEDRMEVMIKSAIVTAPTPDTALWSNGQSVAITGTVSSPSLSHFTVSIADESGADVPASSIALTGGGTGQITGSTLATWNASGLPAGHYTVTLNVFLKTGAQESIVAGTIIMDPALHPGWPVLMPIPGLGTWSASPMLDHFVAADIDGDGYMEIPVVVGDSITVYRHDGTIAAGWPRYLSDYEADSASLVSRAPSIGDINGDGRPEIVVTTSNGNVYAFEPDGTLAAGYPLPDVFGYQTAIADINGDGKNELIVSRWDVTAIDSTGKRLAGWPALPQGHACQPAIGDMDGDGKVEVVVNTEDKVLHVLGGNGLEKSGWPRNYGAGTDLSFGCDSLVLADLDGDGKLEAIITTDMGVLHVIGSSGNELAGWPKQVLYNTLHAPAVADLDGDGKLEIVVGANISWDDQGNTINQIFAFRADGTSPAGWPVVINLGASATWSFGASAPTIADIDGDGKPEVLVSVDTESTDHYFSLRAFRSDGTAMTSFLRPALGFGLDASEAALVADVDHDGKLELLWGSSHGELALYDLSAAATSATPWPMALHDAGHTCAARK